MKISALRMILPLLALIFTFDLQAQAQYTNHAAQISKAESLVKEYPSLCSVRTLVKTAGSRDIIVLTIGTGDKDNKPGIAIVGGVEGNYIAGREISLGFAENILKDAKDPEVKRLLENITFYIFPDIAPDASEQYFAALKYEKVTNSRQTDNDRDFEIDEDPYEDLNGDGYITLIRVSDPAGNYIVSADDKRIMVPADLSKGEKGSYLVFSEGIDNDKDGKYNEDDKGGVNSNRNFTYNFEEYGLNSGYHAMSEPETKALADFLFDHFNIYMTFAFGPQDNLGQPMKASEKQPEIILREPGAGRGSAMSRGFTRESSDRRITSITKQDELINKLVSEKYHEITGAKGNPPNVMSPGNFSDWAYYHYGRYSFTTPGWWYPVEKGKNSEIAFLSYAGKKNITDVFVPWTEIRHPDFPGKKTEAGGIKPFVLINPPSDTLDALVKSHYKFIKAVAEMHPELEYLDTKVEDAGNDIYRVSTKVHNKGLFATMAEVGLMNQWTRLMLIKVEPEKGQSIVSGQKIQRIRRLAGGDSEEFSWLISGKGKLSVSAGAVNTGIINTTLEIK